MNQNDGCNRTIHEQRHWIEKLYLNFKHQAGFSIGKYQSWTRFSRCHDDASDHTLSFYNIQTPTKHLKYQVTKKTLFRVDPRLVPAMLAFEHRKQAPDTEVQAHIVDKLAAGTE